MPIEKIPTKCQLKKYLPKLLHNHYIADVGRNLVLPDTGRANNISNHSEPSELICLNAPDYLILL